MVVPAGTNSPVWGWALPNQEVSVTLGEQTVSARADKDGKWKLALKNLVPDNQPLTLTVKSGDKTITCNNVLVGDVWLGSGQSNMEFPVDETLDAKKHLAKADCPTIRLFKICIRGGDEPLDDIQGSNNRQWFICTPENVAKFGATLYYFGREIQDKIKTPVGLVLCAAGGSAIEPFLSREGIESTLELADLYQSIRWRDRRWGDFSNDAAVNVDKIEAWAREVRKARDEKRDPPRFPNFGTGGALQLPRGVTRTFNGCISPITPFAIRGVVWYQGEGNEQEEDSYAFKMKALVNGWRQCWNRPDLPFYYIQLANFTEPDDRPEGVNSHGYGKIRMGQLKALPELPHAGMAVTVDITDGDLHPKNKQEIGQRLSLWALKNEYGLKGLVPSGPLFKAMRIEGRKAIISFDYAETGLMVGEKNDFEPVKEIKDGKLTRFAIAGADRKWYWADTKIKGGEVLVSCKDVPEPVAVRYAFSMNPRGCNLYNKAGLPASPFRTDRWPLPWWGR
ncbi:MAG: sialate O-acetylesterase [bacterium]